MKENFILFPLLRDFKAIPPTIAIINYLAERGYNLLIFTYHTEIEFSNTNIQLINCSNEAYPNSFVKRVMAKTLFHLKFYTFFLKKRENIKFIWLGAWDVKFLNFFKKGIKIIYQFHELEVSKYANCRKSDFVIVPEENRGWITYFQAKLKNKPLLLPNIPFYSGYEVRIDLEIENFRNKDKIVVLYSGLIDNKKRSLIELVASMQFLEKDFILLIIPSFVGNGEDMKKLKSYIKELKLEERIFFLQSRVPPKHLDAMKTADIGVGFYSPISLNNVYAAPNRIFEFINNGTPVVLPNYPIFKALSMAYPLAVNVANPSVPKEIASSIKKIVSNKKLMKESIIKFKTEQGNYNKFAEQIEKIIFKNEKNTHRLRNSS